MGFEPTTSCIRGKRLSARPQGPRTLENKHHRGYIEYSESIFLRKGTRQVLI